MLDNIKKGGRKKCPQRAQTATCLGTPEGAARWDDAIYHCTNRTFRGDLKILKI